MAKESDPFYSPQALDFPPAADGVSQLPNPVSWQWKLVKSPAVDPALMSLIQLWQKSIEARRRDLSDLGMYESED